MPRVPTPCIYNGPYTITEFNPTEGVTMVKNDDYWNKDNVDIEKVEGKIVKEMDTAVNLLRIRRARRSPR